MDKVYRQRGEEKEEEEGNIWGCLGRPERPKGPAEAAKQQKGPPKREYPDVPSVLQRFAGVNGKRNFYDLRDKLEAVSYVRQRCADGDAVGKRGAGKVLGICPSLLRSWAKQEDTMKARLDTDDTKKGQGSGRRFTLHRGGDAATKEVEEAVVDEINCLRKHGAVVNADLVVAKHLQEMPTFQGGLPPAEQSEAAEKFRKGFKSWYYRFLKRHRFSIRRTTSVGQKKPDGWEGKGVGVNPEGSVAPASRGQGGHPMGEGSGSSSDERRNRGDRHRRDLGDCGGTSRFQAKIFALLYNMDQDTTLAKTGKEKLRYTVVLPARADGGRVKRRIIYTGFPFVPRTDASGKPKKPGKNSLSFGHLPAQRRKFGYQAGGISLGVQKSSWCDDVQCDARRRLNGDDGVDPKADPVTAAAKQLEAAFTPENPDDDWDAEIVDLVEEEEKLVVVEEEEEEEKE
eukprot:g12382.t1